jgi:hypothetical protein
MFNTKVSRVWRQKFGQSKTDDAGQRLVCHKDHANTKTSKHDRRAVGAFKPAGKRAVGKNIW